MSMLISVFLLILSFPKFSFWPLAWVAFVPIFYRAQHVKRLSHAFFHFYLLGFLFFLTTWEWLRHVTYFGWIILALLYAVYFGLFGLLVHWFLRRGIFCCPFLFFLPDGRFWNGSVPKFRFGVSAGIFWRTANLRTLTWLGWRASLVRMECRG